MITGKAIADVIITTRIISALREGCRKPLHMTFWNTDVITSKYQHQDLNMYPKFETDQIALCYYMFSVHKRKAGSVECNSCRGSLGCLRKRILPPEVLAHNTATFIYQRS